MPHVTHLGLMTDPESGLSICQGARAGPWVFLTGLLGGDFEGGLDPEVRGAPGLPLAGLPKRRREGDVILRRAAALLEEAGSSLRHAVRLDQYYPNADAVDPYHHARKAAFGTFIPPSTSVLVEELLIGDAGLDVSIMAVTPGQGMEPRRAALDDVPVPLHSGFAAAALAGDYVFVAGQMANNEALSAIEKGAFRPAKAIWNGTDVRLQTEFLITQRLRPALEAAGGSLANAVKAQVYLTDIGDLPHFMDVWSQHFAQSPCALTVVPASGLGFADAVVEINLLGVRDQGRVRKLVIDHPASAPMRLGPAAVKAGDLVCLSGLFAADARGVTADSARGAQLKPFGAVARRQMRTILRAAEEICAAAGTSLDGVLRAQHFYHDFGGFYPSAQVWSEVVRGPVPMGAVRVPGGHAVPGCEVTVDLWAFAAR